MGFEPPKTEIAGSRRYGACRGRRSLLKPLGIWNFFGPSAGASAGSFDGDSGAPTASWGLWVFFVAAKWGFKKLKRPLAASLWASVGSYWDFEPLRYVFKELQVTSYSTTAKAMRIVGTSNHKT